MTSEQITEATRKPPEGALVGENVPIENDEKQIDHALVEELATMLKDRPGYSRLSRDERIEAAKEKLRGDS